MSQHDYVLDNGPGLAVRTDMNAALKALASSNSGALPPATPYAGQVWLDTSNATHPDGLMKVRNAGNTNWVGFSADVGRLVGLPTPTLPDEVTSKAYVDAAIASGVQDGGTITGNVIIDKASPDLTLQRNASTEGVTITGKDELSNAMWRMYLGWSTGKDFIINRYGSTGAQIDAPFTIDWATGRVIITEGMTITGGIDMPTGGLTIDNLTQKQSASTANLYTTYQNSSGYSEWAWRMDSANKQYELRCYDGLSSGALVGVAISARSSDGKVYFPAGVYGRLDLEIAGEAIRLAGPGASDSPYLTFYQGASRRGYLQYANAAGVRLYNDQSDDYLQLADSGTVDALSYVIGGTAQPVYHRANLFYAGSSVSNASYPVGTYLYCYYNNEALDRNAAATIRLASATFRFELQGSGTVVAGTWRARGQHSDAILMQRVA